MAYKGERLLCNITHVNARGAIMDERTIFYRKMHRFRRFLEDVKLCSWTKDIFSASVRNTMKRTMIVTDIYAIRYGSLIGVSE
jgi:hypothetical protein